MRYLLSLLLLIPFLSCNVKTASKATTENVVYTTQNFHTDGNGIRDIIAAKYNKEPVFYISELDGAVSCYTTDGKKLWNAQTKAKAVLFEINAADIDNDGKDELVAASGDGHIYCWDDNGKLLWAFAPDHKVRFSEIAILKTDKIQIFAGGNDYQLYELDAKGQLVTQTKINGIVRVIETGNFLEAGQPSIFLMTYKQDKFRWDFMGFINPKDKSVEKSLKYQNKKHRSWAKFMMTDIDVADINKDNKDDLLFFGDVAFKGQIIGWNSDFETIFQFDAHKKTKQRYCHGVGIVLPQRDEILYQSGGIQYVLDFKGAIKTQVGQRYGKKVYRDFAYEPMTNQAIVAGEVGGGNGVYQYDLNQDNWLETEHQRLGRMEEVQQNMAQLYQQTLNFKMPSYQQPAKKPWLMVTSFKEAPALQSLKGNPIKYIIQETFTEDFDRTTIIENVGEKEAAKRDKRKKYNLSQAEIVAKAKVHEANNQPFVIWAGHGNDPFYVSIETLEKVLEVAPTTCNGFIYAEMHASGDARTDYFIDEYMPRLAKAIRKNNIAKIYFRNKNVFWAATCHLGKWNEIFFSGKYKDIVAPASEDTSSRTQDINLTGRVGMFVGGYVNDFCMRLVDDNPTSWRPLSPGGQTSISPFLRQGVILAAYGARTGIIVDNRFAEQPHLNTLFALMKSGVLPMVEKEDILSIGSWHLMQDIDKKLLKTINNHHKMNQYKESDDKAVFSVAQMHSAGASGPEYDYSKTIGVNYRWLNYLPTFPNGIIPIAPISSKADLAKNNTPFVVSNMKEGIIDGQKIPVKLFGRMMNTMAKAGATQLPVLVDGASWSAIRLDENHIRVIIVDPNYVNPQQQEVTITFQGKTPKSATDILLKETLSIKKNTVKLTISAGSMRFVDLTY